MSGVKFIRDAMGGDGTPPLTAGVNYVFSPKGQIPYLSYLVINTDDTTFTAIEDVNGVDLMALYDFDNTFLFSRGIVLNLDNRKIKRVEILDGSAIGII